MAGPAVRKNIVDKDGEVFAIVYLGGVDEKPLEEEGFTSEDDRRKPRSMMGVVVWRWTSKYFRDQASKQAKGEKQTWASNLFTLMTWKNPSRHPAYVAYR